MDKILVGLKRVVDYNVRVRVKPDNSGVVTEGLKMSINPFDEIALEEALRIRERGEATEVIAVSVGTADVQQQLRTGLAMGADRAILVESDDDIDSLATAKIFLKLIDKEESGGDQSRRAYVLAQLRRRQRRVGNRRDLAISQIFRNLTERLAGAEPRHRASGAFEGLLRRAFALGGKPQRPHSKPAR